MGTQPHRPHGDLWNSALPPTQVFWRQRVARLPEAARQYLEHAITPGTALATVVRLRMHGEIKVGRWLPFNAEQTIHAARGFMWTATVPFLTIPVIRGFDRFLDGAGKMRWRVLGIFPLMSASGEDITRSSIGRMEAESIWLPSRLVRDSVRWTARDRRHAVATCGDSDNTIEFAIDDDGRLTSVSLQRWGNPDGGPFRLLNFGGIVGDERTFDGYTIPTGVRVGWYFGTPRFETEGEFFHATIEQAMFR